MSSVADVAFVVDLAPSKQGRYLPGSRIPIYSPTKVDETRPDYLLILTWDLRDEIIAPDVARSRLGLPVRRAAALGHASSTDIR